MITLSLRDLARALGGEVCGGQVLAPGPGHGPRDRSLSVRLSATAPEGFIVFSHAGDDFATSRDYVRERLGLDRCKAPRRGSEDRKRPPALHPDEDTREQKIARALSLWAEGVNPRATLAELYLRSRHLDLDADENVVGGLNIGEGAETCQAARQLGLRPAWALGSAGAIAAFSLLSGVECLTLLTENDEAGRQAVEACARRWHDAGRQVLIDRALLGKDLNDALALRGAS